MQNRFLRLNRDMGLIAFGKMGRHQAAVRQCPVDLFHDVLDLLTQSLRVKDFRGLALSDRNKEVLG